MAVPYLSRTWHTPHFRPWQSAGGLFSFGLCENTRASECEGIGSELIVVLVLVVVQSRVHFLCINTTHPFHHALSLPLHILIVPRQHTVSHSNLSLETYSRPPNNPHLFHTTCSLNYLRVSALGNLSGAFLNRVYYVQVVVGGWFRMLSVMYLGAW